MENTNRLGDDTMLNARHMLFILFWLVFCLSLVSTAYGESALKWCGVSDYDKEHPLAWNKLKPEYDAQASYRDGYLYIMSEFDGRYGIAYSDKKEMQDFHKAFEKHLSNLDNPKVGDRPQDWRENYIRDEERGEYLLYALSAPESDAVTELIVPCNEFTQADSSYLAAIAYAAFALRRAGESDLKFVQRPGTAAAEIIYRGYKDMLYNGLAMWPWELYVNGIFVPDDFKGPPRKTQLTVLRPNVGLQLKFDGLDDSQADYAFSVEPIGFVRYVDDSNYKQWWGASPLITITDDNGIGLGGLLRYNNYTLGATYHDQDENVLMYLSVDLHDYFLGENGKIKQANEFLQAHKSKFLPKLN